MNKSTTRAPTPSKPPKAAQALFLQPCGAFRPGGIVRLNDKDNTDVIPATIEMDGDTETATFLYRGYEYSLSADRFIPKGYPTNIEGQPEKKR